MVRANQKMAQNRHHYPFWGQFLHTESAFAQKLGKYLVIDQANSYDCLTVFAQLRKRSSSLLAVWRM
jgi:hypothetical protein